MKLNERETKAIRNDLRLATIAAARIPGNTDALMHHLRWIDKYLTPKEVELSPHAEAQILKLEAALATEREKAAYQAALLEELDVDV